MDAQALQNPIGEWYYRKSGFLFGGIVLAKAHASSLLFLSFLLDGSIQCSYLLCAVAVVYRGFLAYVIEYDDPLVSPKK